MISDLVGKIAETPVSRLDRAPGLLDFAQAAYPGFHIGRHHQKIARALESVVQGTTKRLIISVPPRHGKSLLSSILFPAWALGRSPDTRIIACSYSADLSYTFSRQARNLLASPEYRGIFPDVQVAQDARAVGQWELAAPHRGGYVSAGVGGSITGKGAHILLIDDPVKDRDEANSASILDRKWDWYTSTAYTRLEGQGAVILIMTRWSDDDLAGRLLKAMQDNGDADQWETVHLPALAESDDILGREIDEALWPEKYSTAELRRIAVNVGSRDFAALYQQRPSPAGGSIFQREWWKRYATFDRSQASQVIQVWDTAFKATQTADYSVCTTWALTPAGAYVLDMFRARVEFPELKRTAVDLHARWQPVAVLIEDKASGQSLIQELNRDTPIPVIPVPVGTDKVTNAHAVTPYIEAGRVFVPESAPWVGDFLEEHASFPNGKHDDIVDCTSMALKRLFAGQTLFRPGDIAAAVQRDLSREEWLFD